MTQPATSPLVHVCPAAAYAAAAADDDGVLRPPSLDEVGFVHLCTPAQLPGVLERFYADVAALVVLHVDPAGLPLDALVWEEGEPGEDFPHLHAGLPIAAVVAVVPVSDATR